MRPCGLFIGRSVVDVINTIDAFPEPEGKSTASAQVIVGGGPALNAAITFAHLGGRAVLYSSFGASVFGRFARAECESFGVEIIDRAATLDYPFPVSSVLSVAGDGSRCVINSPASHGRRPIPSLDGLDVPPDIILLDQFEDDAVVALSDALRGFGSPIVLDGGSWKPASPFFLDLATLPIVSARFRPPATEVCVPPEQFLIGRRNAGWAVTHGAAGVVYGQGDQRACMAAVPIAAVDTLGAGDIFHGAFCFFYARQANFADALRSAGAIAAESCRYAGTREWMSARTGR